MTTETPTPDIVTAENIIALYAAKRRDFQKANLRWANLRYANLRWANLRWADLSWANLSGADLSGANLSGANLSGANLSGANLRGADLSGANLHGANLRGADLRGANLGGADLGWASLSGANLRGANLRGADLSGANLHGANLRGAENIDATAAARLMRCPPDGAFVGYKQCRYGVIVKLMIPAESRRSSATGYKCRAEFVDVIEGDGVSIHDGKTTYTPGQRVTCHEWDADRWNECGGGIHFYMSREEAEAHS